MKTQNIKLYPPLTHAEDLEQICKPLASLGINYFAHVRIDKKNQFSAIGLKPEFVKVYLEKSYYNYDIHMATTQDHEQYIIDDLIELDKQSLALRDDMHSFNLYHTFTIATPGELGNDYFHFATTADNHSANNNYLQQLPLLKNFIRYFKDKIHQHKELATSHRYKFSINEEAEFYTATPLWNSEDALQNQQLSVNRIYINDSDRYLTKREFECLHYLSMAKTIEEIAILLGISARTVKAHIVNIKEKSGCRSLFQLGQLHQKLQFLFG